MQRINNICSLIIAWVSLLFLSSCDNSGDTRAPNKQTHKTDGLGKQDWPIYRGNAELHGESVEKLKLPLQLAWVFTPEVDEGERSMPFDATPVVVDGVVYIGDQSGLFYALRLDSGQEIWRFRAESAIAGAAAVYGARVFFGDTGGRFYALNIETGIEAWNYQAWGPIQGGPNLLQTDDGIVRVFFGSEDAFLYCLNGEDGTLLWKHETDNQVVATPTIINSGGEQAIVFGGCDGVLHIVPVVQPDWELYNKSVAGIKTKGKLEELEQPQTKSSGVEVGANIANSSSVRDGIAYVAHDGGEVLAVDISEKKIRWLVETGFKHRGGGSAAVGSKYVYVPSDSKKLSVYDRETGEIVWEFSGRKSLHSSPVITESIIWQAGMDGFLYALDRKTGEEKWSWEMGERIKSSPAISQGKLVIASQSGSVYALNSLQSAEQDSR